MAIALRTEDQVRAIERAAVAAARIAGVIARRCVPGARTESLDALAASLIAEAGASSALADDAGTQGVFPGAIAMCINNEAANAPPGRRTLAPGDVVTVDVALRLDGWCADVSHAVALGAGDATRLVEAAGRVTRAALNAVAPGVLWCEVVRAAYAEAEAIGVRIVTPLRGHAIGRRLHEPGAFGFDPDDPSARFPLVPGMVFTVEPVVTFGRGTAIAPGAGCFAWRTADGAAAAFEERTAAVTEGGVRVLGGSAR